MKSIKIIIILAIMGGLLSCERPSDLSYFEKQWPVPPPWSNATDFETAVIGAYWITSGPQGYQYAFMNARLVLDAASDGAFNNPTNFASDAFMPDIYSRKSELNNTWTDNAFATAYMVIGSTNDAIGFLEKYPAHNPFPTDLQKAQLPRLEGELHFLRAFNWWVLSTLFQPMYIKGGANDDKIIPWRPTLPGNYSEAVAPELASTKQIYDLMVSDLKLAIRLIPEKYVDGRDHPSFQFGRANKYAAMAILARVYMQMNEFDLAKAYCDTIINYSESTGTYSLTKDPINAFNTADGTVYPGQETIWQYLQFDGDGIGSWKIMTAGRQMTTSTYNNYVNSGRTICCSDNFLETVGWQNPSTKQPTAEALADKRYNQLYHRFLASTDRPAGYPTPTDGVYEPSFTTTRAYVWGDKYFRNTTINRQKTNIPMIRLPEIYLTRAILRFKAANVPGATSDVNKVRARAGLSALATVTETQIHNERWKEFNFEGDRVTYLRSLRIDIPNGDRGAGVLTWNSPKWIWAIQLRERELNNIVP